MRPILRAASIAFCAFVPVLGQESAPADPVIAALKPSMTQLMSGGMWSENALQEIVETLVAKQLHGAAFWWVTLGQEAIKNGKLPRSAEPMLKTFAKACDRKGSSPADRKLAAKVVRVVESMAASKNIGEGRRSLGLARAMTRIAPDPATTAAVERLERDFGASPENRDPARLAELARTLQQLKPELEPMINARLEALLAEYARAGNRIGRFDLGIAMEGAAEVIGAEKSAAFLNRLLDAAKQVEPSRKLTVLLRGTGTTQGFRFGVPARLAGVNDTVSAEGGEPLVLDVFDGEAVQFAVTNFAMLTPTDPTKSYVVAAAATLEGKPLDWSGNKSSRPGGFVPELTKLGTVTRVVDPKDPRITHIPDKMRFFGAFMVDGHSWGGRRHYSMYEAQFAKLGLPLSWVGGLFEQLALVVVVPVR